MLKWNLRAPATWLLLLGGIILAGCSGGDPADKSAASGSASADPSDVLAEKLGEYMPPLDEGRLEIAACKGWNWGRPGGEILVVFKPQDAEINSLPRVLLTVEESPFLELDNVTPANVEDFVSLVADSLADAKPQEPVRAVTAAGQPFAQYTLLAKRRSQIVVRQVLQTIVDSRVYTLQLEVYQPELDQHKMALNVIAASMKFPVRDGAEPADSTDTDLAEPAAADGEPIEDAAAAEAEVE